MRPNTPVTNPGRASIRTGACKIPATGTGSTVTTKGQITIPREVRSAMRLSKGDRIRFEPDRKGYRIVKDSQAGNSAGILSDFVPKRKQPVTVEEMKEAAKEAVAERFRKSSQR